MNFLLTVVRWTMDDVPFSAASNILFLALTLFDARNLKIDANFDAKLFQLNLWVKILGLWYTYFG